MRQDYVHNRGKASGKQAKNKRLKWFDQGDLMIPTSANYEQLFRELQSELGASRRTSHTHRGTYAHFSLGQVPVNVRNLFEQTAAAAGLGIDAALEAALTEGKHVRQQN